MNTKLKNYIQMAGRTAEQVTKNLGNWTGFLNTASHLYRYPFPDQLMIHAQRPKATACAEFDVWSRRMNRHIRRGSRGIGLVNVSGSGYPKIRYVFDIRDTELRRNSADLFQWQYKEEYYDAVTKALEEQFGVSEYRGFAEQLGLTAVKLVNRCWVRHHDDIICDCVGSRLEGLEESEISVKFRMASAASIMYILYSRCGFDPGKGLKADNFKDIPDFDTQKMVKILGDAVSQFSGQVLRAIAVAIYQYEYQKKAARDASHASQPQPDGNAGDARPSKQPVGKVYDKYKPIIREIILLDKPYQNACKKSDRQNAALECTEAVKRAALTIKDAEFVKPFYDVIAFRKRLRNELLDETYPVLSAVQTTEPAAEEARDSENSIQDTKQDKPDAEEPSSAKTEPVQETSKQQEVSVPEPHNCKPKEERLGASGPKARFRMNMNAIRTLKRVEAEDRAATPDERQMLSRYAGWGGIPDAFEVNRADWKKEYQELFDALTQEEYASARQSTLNAHYTGPVIIRAMYKVISNTGFTSGRILELACSIGRFFGLLPEGMSGSKLYGVEKDCISGRIAKLLYPDAQIHVTGYEKTDFPKDYFDLAIGNVPFGQYQVNDPEYNKLGFSIHNYFLAKVLDQVRPGGILAFITTRYTMDSNSAYVREYLAERADLLGAIRLPNNAFKANVGTDVVSDILFLQKRSAPYAGEPEWVQTGKNAHVR